MENKTLLIDPLFEKVENYVTTSVELCKLKAVHQSAGIVAMLVLRALVFITVTICLLFASIGVALWLGIVLGTMYYGFLCVALFYGSVGVILYFFVRKAIKNGIVNAIIAQLLS